MGRRPKHSGAITKLRERKRGNIIYYFYDLYLGQAGEDQGKAADRGRWGVGGIAGKDQDKEGRPQGQVRSSDCC